MTINPHDTFSTWMYVLIAMVAAAFSTGIALADPCKWTITSAVAVYAYIAVATVAYITDLRFINKLLSQLHRTKRNKKRRH